MANIIRLLRSITAGARPTGKSYGEAYANFTDRAMGMVDSTGRAVDFIAPWMGRGYVNRFVNPNFSSWQRGNGVTIPTSGSNNRIADCWLLYPVGATVTATGSAVGNWRSRFNLNVPGVAGLTSFTLRQRIESWNAMDFNGNPFTIQIKVFQSSGATITPTVSIATPTAQDNFTGTLTQIIGNTALQPVPNNTWTQCAYSFPAQTLQSMVNGMQIDFIFSGGFSTGQVAIAEADIRITTGIPAGLNSNPPPAELPDIHIINQQCRRYFFRSAFNTDWARLFGVIYLANAIQVYPGRLPVIMRTNPTMSDANVTSLTALDVAGGFTGIVGASSLSGAMTGGQSFNNYTNISGSPFTTLGRMGVIYCLTTPYYYIDYSAEL